MTKSIRWTLATLAVLALLYVLLVIEAGIGHDGLLCELGWDTDGPGDTISGCG